MENPWCYQTITFFPFCTWVASTSTFYILAPLSVLFHPSIRGWGRKPSLRWQQSATQSAQLAIHSRNIPLLQKWGLTGGSSRFVQFSFSFFFGHFIALHIETLSFFCEWSGLLVQIWRSHWIVVSQARSVTHLVKEPLSTDEKEGARSKARVSSTSPTSAAVAVPVRRQWDERIHYSAHPHGDPKELHPFPSLLFSLWFLLLMSFPLFSTFWLMIQWLFVHVTWVKT